MLARGRRTHLRALEYFIAEAMASIVCTAHLT